MTTSQYPPFVFSLYERRDGQGALAYKVLDGPADGKAAPLVLVHGCVPPCSLKIILR